MSPKSNEKSCHSAAAGLSLLVMQTRRWACAVGLFTFAMQAIAFGQTKPKATSKSSPGTITFDRIEVSGASPAWEPLAKDAGNIYPMHEGDKCPGFAILETWCAKTSTYFTVKSAMLDPSKPFPDPVFDVIMSNTGAEPLRLDAVGVKIEGAAHFRPPLGDFEDAAVSIQEGVTLLMPRPAKIRTYEDGKDRIKSVQALCRAARGKGERCDPDSIGVEDIREWVFAGGWHWQDLPVEVRQPLAEPRFVEAKRKPLRITLNLGGRSASADPSFIPNQLVIRLVAFTSAGRFYSQLIYLTYS